jgi:holliday junction DNA helicase RuvB
LQHIAIRSAGIINTAIKEDAAMEIAKRSRRTPRIVNRLLKRVADFALVEGLSEIDINITQYALDKLDIDKAGLDDMDRKILKTIIENYSGGPVGLKTIAISVGEDTGTLEDFYEPFLVQSGFIKRTPRGREVTKNAYDHLGIPYMPLGSSDTEQYLFDDEEESPEE